MHVQETNDLLLQQARDRSARGRLVLATSITDFYAAREASLSARERELIDDILGQIVSAFERELRRELADRLAAKPKVPLALILALANDQIEVARPILMQSRVLAAEDLIDIVGHRGKDHQLAIAGRAGLGEAVSAALVETDNVIVIETLLRNQEARIDAATLGYLVEEARWIESYREPLVRRPELTTPQAKALYGLVSAALRQHLLEAFGIDPGELDDALEEIVVAKTSPPAAPSQGAEGEAHPPLHSRLASLQEVTPSLLIRVLRKGDFPLFESLFADFSGLRRPRLKRVLYGPTGKQLAIACRALEVPKADFAVIFFLTRESGRGGEVGDPRDVARLVEYFERIAAKAARQKLALWRRDPDYVEAIEKLETGQRNREPT